MSEIRSVLIVQLFRCSKWAIVFHDRDSGSTQNFVKLLVKASQNMGFQLAPNPLTVPLKDNKANTYGKEVDALCKKQPNMIVIVVPNNKGDAYSVVKKICCGEQGIPSQVVTGTVLGKDKSKLVSCVFIFTSSYVVICTRKILLNFSHRICRSQDRDSDGNQVGRRAVETQHSNEDGDDGWLRHVPRHR